MEWDIEAILTRERKRIAVRIRSIIDLNGYALAPERACGKCSSWMADASALIAELDPPKVSPESIVAKAFMEMLGKGAYPGTELVLDGGLIIRRLREAGLLKQ